MDLSQVERVKRVLSTQHQARVEIESLVDGEDFSETLTRARFEEVRDAHFCGNKPECSVELYGCASKGCSWAYGSFTLVGRIGFFVK